MPKMTRTDFLKITGLTTAGLLGFSNRLPAKRSTRKKSISIIGAGLSGVYAAYLLSQKGFPVTLIEAQKEVGGRIKSISSPGFPGFSELGGEFIYSYHTTLLSLVEQFKLTLERFELQEQLYFPKKSQKLRLSPHSREILQRLLFLKDKMSRKQKLGLDKLNLYNYLKYQGVSQGDLFLLDLKYSQRFGESIRNVSANYGIAVFDFESIASPLYRIQEGNQSLLEKLLQASPKVKRILGDPVKTIRQESRRVVLGLASGRKIQSSYCICTIPTTVLDKIDWQPGLPKDKTLSALQLRYGRISKSAIFASNVQKRSVSPLFFYTDAPQGSYFLPKTSSQEKALLTTSFAEGNSQLFYRTNTAKQRKLIEVAIKTFAIFKTIKIDKIISLAWQYEPYILGARSVLSPGTFGVLDSFRSPHRRVFFAGEHLGDEMGTMNSALVSAQKVVAKIS
ncbi:MAG: NAD(P)/FAD-dependent oxidoreductase [Spirochaetota bacterium]